MLNLLEKSSPNNVSSTHLNTLAQGYIKESLSIEGRGWGCDLILGIAGLYFGDPILLICASLVRGSLAIYSDFLRCLSFPGRLQHEAMRDVAICFGLLFMIPMVLQGHMLMGLIAGLLGGIASAFVGCSNGWFAVEEVVNICPQNTVMM